MKTETLYKISQDYRELIYKIELSDGLLSDETETALIINKNHLEIKALSYLEVIKVKKGRVSMAKERIKDVQSLIKREQRTIDILEDNLLSAVKLHGEFEADFVKFGTRKSSSISVEDVNSLPRKYKTIKIIETANKAELKRAIQSGEIIEGVELLENINLKIT